MVFNEALAPPIMLLIFLELIFLPFVISFNACFNVSTILKVFFKSSDPINPLYLPLELDIEFSILDIAFCNLTILASLEDKLFIAPSISPILFLKLSKFKESNFICKLFKTLVLINPLSFATFNLS